MAAPIAHIFVALALLQSGALSVDNKQEFLLGTSFPDIRYLGVIDRAQTHQNPVSWADVIAAESSFKAGMLVHALLDQKREAFLVANNVYNLIPPHKGQSQILKFFEDSLLYPLRDNWATVCVYFDVTAAQEYTFGISESSLIQWHTLLKKYCSQKPQINSLMSFIQEINIAQKNSLGSFLLEHPALTTLTIKPYCAHYLRKLRRNKKVAKILLRFYANVVPILMNS